MKPTSRRDLLYIILSMFVLTLGTVFIPFFSFFAMCVMPVPVVWMYMRATWRETAALAIGAVILTVYWGGSYGGTVETGFFCLSGMIMGFGLRKRRSFFSLLGERIYRIMCDGGGIGNPAVCCTRRDGVYLCTAVCNPLGRAADGNGDGAGNGGGG